MSAAECRLPRLSRAREGKISVIPRKRVRRASHGPALRPQPRMLPCSEPLEPRCLLNAGDLDASFNGTGQATADFGPGVNAFAVAPAVQSDGKTVVAGYLTGGVRRIAVARFN